MRVYCTYRLLELGKLRKGQTGEMEKAGKIGISSQFSRPNSRYDICANWSGFEDPVDGIGDFLFRD
jgi:hypothetical protein